MSAKKAWATIEKLAQYEEERWNDPVIPEGRSLDHENPDIEKLLGVMECKVGALMEEAILLMKRSGSVFEMTSNLGYRLPLEPSRHEAFKDLVVEKLKDEIRREENRVKKIEKITRYPGTEDPNSFSNHKFPNSFHAHNFISPKPLYIRYNSAHVGVSYRLGGEDRTMSLLELWRRIGLYFEKQSRDGDFVVGGTTIKRVRDPKVRLAHRLIAPTILGRKESNHRVTVIDLFYLYCIYGKEVTCNIYYWLARYLKGVRDKDLICGGMFVTRIARSFGLQTNAMVDALSVETRAHIFKKKSLVAMNVLMDLSRGTNCWPATRQGNWQEEQANWMYDHTVRHFQYLSTRDNLDPHLQIDPFLRPEADYPPYGYLGYEYCPDPSHDGSF
ncbi:hypothetical protein Tco_1176494 [Tanacetum coccineum]